MSAARDLRRAQIHKIRRHLADAGCRCDTPVRLVEHDDVVDAVEDVIGGRIRAQFEVTHDPWCPEAARCQAGVLPVVLFNSGRECER